jgi:AcrR family transcriptional regulator
VDRQDAEGAAVSASIDSALRSWPSVRTMVEGETHRRQGYGPTSPVVGRRGERTRTRILNEARELFERRGYRGASVEAIAQAAGISRAAMYQYFESKEVIFVELLEECRSVLTRLVGRLGPLGPTREGFGNLHWWLGEWAWVYDKYSAMFMEWDSVEPSGVVRSMVLGSVQSLNARIARRLTASGVEGLDPESAALALSTVVHRFNHFRHRGFVSLPSDDEALDGLTVTMQLMLFPSTPSDAFIELGKAQPPTAGAALPTPAATDPALLTASPGKHLSPRAAATAQVLLAAGEKVFAERGFHCARAEDVASAAGYSRSTFYRIFDGKLDLFTALSRECRLAVDAVMTDLLQIEEGAGQTVALRDWVIRFVRVHRRYRAVFRAWVDGTPATPEVTSAGEQSGAVVRSALMGILQRVQRSYPLNLDVAVAVFEAILDGLPAAVQEMDGSCTDAQVTDLLVAVVGRGLLNGGGSS